MTTADAFGKATTFHYDPVQSPFGQPVRIVDAFGNLTSTTVTDEPGNISRHSTFGYDDGQLTEVRDAEDRLVSSFIYNEFGDLTSTTDPNGVVRHFVYDVYRNQTLSYFHWDDADLIDKTVVTRTFYDDEDRVKKTAQYTLDGPHDYNDAEQFDIPGGPTPDWTTETHYDDAGRVERTVDRFGNQTYSLYDLRGNVVETRTRGVDENDVDERIISRTLYDDNGRAYFTTDPYVVTQATYASDSNTGQPALGTHTKFDALGRVVRNARYGGVQVNLTNEMAGHKTSVTSFNFETADEISESLTYYDGAGRVEFTVDPAGLITQFKYDDAGQQQEMSQYLSGTYVPGTTWDDDIPEGEILTTKFHYDDLGRQYVVTDARRHSTQTVLDALGRVTKTIFHDGTITETKYNKFGQREAEIGQYDPEDLADLTDAAKVDFFEAITTNYEYDISGRLKAVVLPPVMYPGDTGPYAGQMVRPRYEYEYDQNGNQTVIHDNVVQLLDSDGTRVTDHDGAAGDDYRETHFTYDEAGRQTSRTLPLGVPNGNGFAEQMVYDELGRQVRHVGFENKTTDFIYDELGRLHKKHFFNTLPGFEPGQGIDNGNDGTVNVNEVVDYVYDAFGRETQVIQDFDGDLASTTGQRVTDNTYDDEGRLESTSSAEGVIFYDYFLETGQLRSTSTGSLTSPTTKTEYEYDRLGRLIEATASWRDGVDINPDETTEYRYDPVGNLQYVILPNDVVSFYKYDALKRLDELTQFRDEGNTQYDGTEPLLASFDYDMRADGKRSGLVERFYNDSGVLVQTNVYAWAYDAADRLTEERFSGDGNKESWNYRVAGFLNSTAAADGIFSKTRQTDGSTQLHSTSAYSLANNARLYGSAHGSATIHSQPSPGNSTNGSSDGRFSFSSSASLIDAGTARRTNDDYTTIGNARLDYSGWASERSTGRAHTKTTSDSLDTDIHSQAVESLYGSIDGHSLVAYTLTRGGERILGSYGTSLSGTSLSAAQAHGTITEKIPDEPDITTPVRDNEATSFSLTASARGDFTYDSLGTGLFGQPAESTAKGHVTRSETTSRRASSYAGLAGELDELPEPIPIPMQLGASRISKSTFDRTYREDYTYDDTNGSRSRRGTFDDVTAATSESRLSIPKTTVDEGDTKTSYSYREDGGSRRDTTGTGSFSEGGANGRTVNSVGDEDVENFGARKATYTTSANDGQGNRSGSTATSSSKSKNNSTGRGSSTSNGVDETFGPSTYSSDLDSRHSDGGSSWSQGVTETSDEDSSTVTRAVRASDGNSRGELTGNSSGRDLNSPSGSNSTTTSNARQSGRAGGGGSENVVSLTTSGANGEIKDGTITVSRGRSNGKANGSANGTVDSGNQGADSTFNVNAHADSDGNGSTTHITMHHDPASRSRTAVTRSDTGDGNLHSNGTITSDPGTASGRDGTFHGQSDNGAKVTFNHNSNTNLGAGTFSFATASGTLTGDEGLNFNGDWNGEELHADLVRKSKENSNSTDGTRTFTIDADGLHWSGETTKRNIDNHGDDSGGNSTDEVNVTSWDYDIQDFQNYKLRDRTDTSKLTSRVGTNEEGEPLAGQSVVQTWNDTTRERSFTQYVGDPEPYWYTDIEETTTRKTITDKGERTKTTTLTGEPGSQHAKLEITADSSYSDTTSTLVHTQSDGRDATSEDHHTSDVDTTRSELKTHHSEYTAEHDVDKKGRALNGRFNASSTSSDRSSEIITTKSHANGSDDYSQYVEDHDDRTEEWTHIVETANENGSYYDRPTGTDGVQRAQEAKYTIEYEITTADKGHEFGHTRSDFPDNGTYDIWDVTTDWDDSETLIKTTSGQYGPEGGSESYENRRTIHDYLRQTSRREGSSGLAFRLELIDKLDIGPGENGQPQGHLFYHNWNDREDGTIQEILIKDGDPFGVVHVKEYYNGQLSAEYDIVNGEIENLAIYPRPTKWTGGPPPDGIAAAIAAGLFYGAIEVGNAGVKLVTLGNADFDEAASYYGDAAGLSETDQRLTRLAANIGVNAAVAAAAPGVLGALGKTPAGQALGGVLANPVAQGTLRGVGIGLTGLNGVNAARNGIATAEALADGRYLDALESAVVTTENALGAFTGARALFAKPRGVAVEEVPELQINAGKYPELAENIRHAQKAGHPDILTHGGNGDLNRAAALKGIPRVPGLSPDEYPFASSMEGGVGSWIGHIPLEQQRAQGGLIADFLRKNSILPGDQYRVIIDE